MTNKIILAVLVCALFGAANSISAQNYGVERGEVPVMEIGAYYDFFHANAPPGQCGCFNMSGGGGTIVVNAPRGLSLVADLSGGHAAKVDGTTQNISLFDYLAGLRYSYRHFHRFTPYIEGLAGGSLELSNYAYVQQSNADAFAAMAGGGVSFPLSRRIGWSVEADYIHSQLPNGVNNSQNLLRVSTGILLRFGPR